MGVVGRLRERWRRRKGQATGEAEGSAQGVHNAEGESPPGTPSQQAVGLTSRPSMANATLAQSIVILFENMSSGFWRFTADVQAALGLTSVVAPSAAASPDDVVLDQPQDGEYVPDPPELLPKFGNWPVGERQGNHCCASVDTYFKVRGKTYLKDRIKTRSAPRMFEFLGADMIRGTSSARDICAHPEGIMASPQYQRLYKAALKKQQLGEKKRSSIALFGSPQPHKHNPAAQPERAAAGSGAPFIFAINFALPRAPALAPDEYVNIVMYYGRIGESDNAEWEALWARFLKMTPQQRGSRLKLLPVIVNGSQAFQNSIANKPAIIGNKLKCSWFESANHLECIIEVGTSLLASQMWKLMLPQAKHLSMDMAWVIEGQTVDELPEVVVAAAHLSRPDMLAYRRYSEVPKSPAGSMLLLAGPRPKSQRRFSRRGSDLRKDKVVRRGTDTDKAANAAEEEPARLAVRTRTI